MSDNALKEAVVNKYPVKGWQKGQSGNPKGRPSARVDIHDMCRRIGPRAVHILDRLLDDADPRVRYSAAVAILDRGFGKPVQAIAAADERASLTFLHLVAARAFGEQQRVIEGSVDMQRSDSTNVDTAKPADINTPALE